MYTFPQNTSTNTVGTQREEWCYVRSDVHGVDHQTQGTPGTKRIRWRDGELNVQTFKDVPILTHGERKTLV